MRLIYRLILKEFIGPFLFGVGSFMVILVGIQLSPWMLRLLVREDYPADIVFRIFVYRVPYAMALTFPMATIFGSLMCLASLSSHGEVVAMRAGGVSLLRLSAPVLAAGLIISLANLGFNELLVPPCNARAQALIVQYAKIARPRENMTFSIPATGPPQRIVHAGRFSPAERLLEGQTIIEKKNGRFWRLVSAERAEWQGNEWVLANLQRVTGDPQNRQRTERLERLSFDVGKSPADLVNAKKDTEDMSLRELGQELALLKRLQRPYNPDQLEGLQAIHTHYSLPWAAFGFALIGIPLGLRPVRATTGIGLGLSLVIVFAYYVIFQTMNLIGEQGAMPPALTAWFPNVMLLGTGVALLMSARR